MSQFFKNSHGRTALNICEVEDSQDSRSCAKLLLQPNKQQKVLELYIRRKLSHFLNNNKFVFNIFYVFNENSVQFLNHMQRKIQKNEVSVKCRVNYCVCLFVCAVADYSNIFDGW